METLLHDIAVFCAVRGMSKTAFGEKAMNDKAFVWQLEKGRDVLSKTERKVREFMANYAG